jgi:hypothetical protein
MPIQALRDWCYSYCMIYAIWDSLKVVNDDGTFIQFLGQHLGLSSQVSAQIAGPEVLRQKRDDIFRKTFPVFLSAAHTCSPAMFKSWFGDRQRERDGWLQDIRIRFERVRVANARLAGDAASFALASERVAVYCGCAVIAVGAAVVVVGGIVAAGSVGLASTGLMTAGEASAGAAPFVGAAGQFGALGLGYSAADLVTGMYSDYMNSPASEGIVVALNEGAKAFESKLISEVTSKLAEKAGEHSLASVEGLAMMGDILERAVVTASEGVMRSPKFQEIRKRYMQKVAQLPARAAGTTAAVTGIGTLLCAGYEMTEKLEKFQEFQEKLDASERRSAGGGKD